MKVCFMFHVPCFMKKEFIIILSIFAAIAIVFAGIYLLSIKQSRFKQPTEPPLGIQPPQKDTGGPRTATGVKIPETVYAYNGIVLDVGDGYISLKAVSHNNYLTEDQVLKIGFNGQTRFIKYILPKAIPPDVKFVQGKEEPISSSQIQKGDKVEVYSKENIRDALEFKADIIKVLEF